MMRKGFQNKGTSQRWAHFIKNPNQEKTKRVIDNQKVYVVNTHLYEENSSDIVLNQELFADEQVDQYFKITEINKKQSWIVKLTAESFKTENIKNMQSMSLIRIMTDMNQVDYDIRFKFSINIQKLHTPQELKEYHLESIELQIKDQFISRRNQWILNKKIVNTATYPGQIILSRGIKAQISNLIGKGQIVNSGIITNETKIIYRSYSGQQSILIEVSKEQLETDWMGEVMFEKMIKFLRVYFLRNQFIQTNHKYNIILYARLFYPQFSSIEEALIKTDQLAAYQINQNGQVYQDIYRSINIKTPINKYHSKNIQLIQKSFKEFVVSINWEYDKETIIDHYSRDINVQQLQNGCKLAPSEQCNLLEAINLICLQHINEIQQPQLDHTGHNVIVLSAGEMNYICQQELQQLTKQNVLFSNLVLYLISFNNKPLFSTPSFVIQNFQKETIINTSSLLYKDIISKSLINCLYKTKMIQNSDVYVTKDNKVNSKKTINLKNIKIYDKQNNSNQILVDNKTILDVMDIKFECNHTRHYISKQFQNYLNKLQQQQIQNNQQNSVDNDLNNSQQLNMNASINNECQEQYFMEKAKTKQQYWIKSFFFTDLGLQTHNQVFGKFIDDPLLNLITTPSLISHENIYKPTNLSKTLQKIKQKNHDQIDQETNLVDEFIQLILQEDLRSFQSDKLQIFDKKVSNLDSSSQLNSKIDDEIVEKFREFDQNVFILRQNKHQSNSCQSLSIQQQSKMKCSVKKDNLEDSQKQSYPSVDGILEETKKKYENHVNIFRISYYNSSDHGMNKLKSNEQQKNIKNQQFQEAHIKFLEKNIKPESKGKKYKADYKYRLEECDKTHLQFYMSQFKEQFKQKMNDKSEEIQQILEYEKLWKNLTIPLLMNLFNKYKHSSNENGANYNLSFLMSAEEYLEQVIGARLAQNFQIFEMSNEMSNQRYKLSKGSEIHDIHQQGGSIIKFNIINNIKKKQQDDISIVYNFLLFEQRQSTFGVSESIFEFRKKRQWKNFDFFIGGFDEDDQQENQLRSISFTSFKKYYPKQIKLVIIPQNFTNSKESISKIESNIKNMFNMIQNIYKIQNLKDIQFYSKSEFKNIQDKFEQTALQANEYQISKNGNYYFFFEYQQKNYALAACRLNIYWLTTSSPVIAEFIKQINQIAKKLDLKIITLPYMFSTSTFNNVTLLPLKNTLCEKMMKKVVTQKPFNFIYDQDENNDKYLHEKGFIFLEFYPKKILWKEQFLVNQNNLENSNVCENLFNQFQYHIMIIETLASIINSVVK